jgi:hypothetical protein
MNERIRELAEQAGIDFFNSTDPEYCGREYCEAWTEQQQKFAELILQDIDKIVNDLYHALPLEQAGVLLTLDENIKEYFYGVKE